MIKYSAIEIWSGIPSEIINKTCSGLFSAEFKKYVLLSYYIRALCSCLLVCIDQAD